MLRLEGFVPGLAVARLRLQGRELVLEHTPLDRGASLEDLAERSRGARVERVRARLGDVELRGEGPPLCPLRRCLRDSRLVSPEAARSLEVLRLRITGPRSPGDLRGVDLLAPRQVACRLRAALRDLEASGPDRDDSPEVGALPSLEDARRARAVLLPSADGEGPWDARLLRRDLDGEIREHRAAIPWHLGEADAPHASLECWRWFLPAQAALAGGGEDRPVLARAALRGDELVLDLLPASRPGSPRDLARAVRGRVRRRRLRRGQVRQIPERGGDPATRARPTAVRSLLLHPLALAVDLSLGREQVRELHLEVPGRFLYQVEAWLRRSAPPAAPDPAAYDDLASGVSVTSLASDGRCGVCGDSLGAGAVHCFECAAALHPDCWEFAEGCGTYGCGGRREG